MHLAAANGQEGVLQWLLQKYPDMIKQTNNVSEHIIQS